MAQNPVKEPHIPLEELVRGLKYSPQTGAMYRTNSRGKYYPVCSINSKGYRRLAFGNEAYAQHRIAYYMMTGTYYRDYIDHKNGKRSDNSWDNIRGSSPKENSNNQEIHRVRGCVGVFETKTEHHPWSAQIIIEPKVNFNLGRYRTMDAAANAYKWAVGHTEMLREMQGNTRLCSLFRNHLRQLFEV